VNTSVPKLSGHLNEDQLNGYCRHVTERSLISSGSTFEAQIGYSRAVVDGDWVHVSGTTGYDYTTIRSAAEPPTQAQAQAE
jgi:enamine deaminase RidA (YjgF/YER057c/UK114 family)